LTFKTKIFNSIRSFFKWKPAERWIIRLVKGKTADSFIAKWLPNHNQYSRPSFRRVIRSGINYELDISDLMDWFVYFGLVEKSKSELFRLMKKGDVIFDIGANLGEISLNAAKITEETGLVYSFEPGKKNFEKLSRNIELNNFKQLSAFQIALSDRPGKGKEVIREPNNSGMNAVNYSDEGDFSIVTLDQFMAENPVMKIDLIKIDTEGFEMNVLKGGQKTLEHYHPVLFVEVDNDNLQRNGSSAFELISFISKTGYKITNAQTGEVVSENNRFENCHFDLIAKPEFS